MLPRGAVTVFALMTVAGMLLLPPPTGSGTPDARAASLPSGASTLPASREALALQMAAGSLAEGKGPAGGVPWSCAIAGAEAPTCLLPASLASAPVAWQNVTSSVGTPPSTRVGVAMVYDPSGPYVLLFGGENGAGTQLYDDTWTFAAGRWSNITSTAGSPPPSRVSPSVAYDAADGYVLLYGGLAVAGGSYLHDLSDTWSFASGRWSNLTSTAGTPPSGRFSMAMTYDPSTKEVLGFGGEDVVQGILTVSVVMDDDTWSFHAGAWTELHPSGAPSARAGANLVYDPADAYALLYGGVYETLSGSTLSGYEMADTWSYTSGGWTNLSASVAGAPGDLALSGIAWDGNAGRVVMFGGCVPPVSSSCPLSNATWTYLAGTWTDLTSELSVAPSPRASAGMTNDSADGELLLFGGSCGSGCSSADTWTENGLSSAVPLVDFLVSPSTCGPLIVNGASQSSGSAAPLPVGHVPASAPACAGETFEGWNVSGGLSVAFPAGASTTLGISGAGTLTAWYRPPLVATVSANATVVSLGGSVLLTADADGGVAPYSFVWNENGTNLTATGSTLTETFGSAATYTFATWASDARGAAAESTPLTVQVLDQSLPPLNVSVALDDAEGLPVTNASTGVSLTATATVTGGTPTSFVWTENGTTSLACVAATCPESFPHGGTYTFAVTVVDDHGRNANAATTLAVFNGYTSTPPSPLQVTATANTTSVQLDQSVTLTVSATGGVPPYAWYVPWSSETGNNSPSRTSTVSIAFPVSGTAKVRVWVIDAAGDLAGSPLVTVTVTPWPTPPSSGSGSDPLLQEVAGLPLLLWIVLAVAGLLAIVGVALGVRRKRSPPSGGGGTYPDDTQAPSPFPASGPSAYPGPAYAPGPGPPRGPYG